MFLGSFYCFIKMLNIQISNVQRIITFFVAMLIAILSSFLNIIMPIINIPMLIICLLILFLYLFKTQLKLAITCTIISFGVSYIFSVVAMLFVAVALANIRYTSDLSQSIEFLSFTIVGVLQITLLIIPFKLNRYKNGIPFLFNHANEDVAVFISVSILLLVLSISSYPVINFMVTIPLSCILLLGIFLIFWWRNRIKQEYITQIRSRELSELKEELLQSKSEIETLKEKNDNLSKIIHKDNKLIPALELSVRSFIQLGSQNIKDNDKALKLIEDLNNLSIDRKGILKSYEQNNIIAKETGFSGIDALIIYLKNKSLSEDINLSFSLECSIEEIVDIKISVRDFETVLADLLENAIIATKTCDTRQILLHWGLNTNNIFSLYVFDSADSFSPKVLENLGKKRYTTHKQDGGSGIGLFSLFDIAQKNKASIDINQNISSSIFKKKVGIVFDDMSKVRIS